MNTRIALVLMPLLTAALFAPRMEAQNKPSVAPIPFQTSAFDEPTEDPEQENAVGTFRREVPAGKQLVVQHVSLFVLASNVDHELTQAKCLVGGRGVDENGNSATVFHIVQLESRLNPNVSSESFTGGGPLTMYLEAGPVAVECSPGVRGHRMSGLQAYLTGELISK